MYGIVIHSNHPELKDEYLGGICSRTLRRSDVLVIVETPVVKRAVSERPTFYREVYRPAPRPVVVPKRVPRYEVSKPVAERYEVVKTTYTTSFDRYTGELSLKGKRTTAFDSGMLLL